MSNAFANVFNQVAQQATSAEEASRSNAENLLSSASSTAAADKSAATADQRGVQSTADSFMSKSDKVMADATRITHTDTIQTSSGSFPTSGTPSDTPSAIDFASRTINYVNGLPQMGYNVFSFHNSVKDLLMSGALGQYDMTNVNSFISTFPADWRAKFLSSEDGLAELFSHVSELADIAHSLWQQGSQSTQESGWYAPKFSLSTQKSPYDDWNHQARDPYAQHVQNSLNNNGGTYKDGFADHPDYVGQFGMMATDTKLSFDMGRNGLNILSSDASISSAGESGLASMETVLGEGAVVGEEGLLASAGVDAAAGVVTGVGMATGVGEVALALGGLAFVGYEAYKMANGGEGHPILDNMKSKFKGALSWLGY
jgi:hypothetical protein